MTAKDYLYQYKQITWDIEMLTRDIKDLNESIDSIYIDYNYHPKSNKIPRKAEEITIKLNALRDKKQSKVKAAWQKREEIERTISIIKDVDLSRLLYDRYIGLMTWEEIAEDIDKSEYWARSELHNKALNELERIINS